MSHSLARVIAIFAVAGLTMQAHAYSLADMHELLWYMFRQHPNGVEAIYDHNTVLLPPQENRMVVPKRFTTGAYRVVVPVLKAGQWFVVIARFSRIGEVKRHVTLFETTHRVSNLPSRMVGHFEERVRNTRLVDVSLQASGPIVAQFILQLFGLAKSYDTVENMRSWHLTFLQRRRELMTARRNVRDLDHRQNESGMDEPFRPASVTASLSGFL